MIKDKRPTYDQNAIASADKLKATKTEVDMTDNEFISPHTLSGYPSSEPILVALSGGADSVFLLHKLSEYAAEHSTPIYCAHLNHMIRGDEADRDQTFCRELCERLGVPFFTEKIDVPTHASEHGMSMEAAARDARYGFLYRIMKQEGIKLLATAHNADDNAETMLFNLARGTGILGMCGISPSRKGGNDGKFTVIRPIINFEKSYILKYCKANGIDFVTDSTNSDTDYSRNRIRANVIPEMRLICPTLTRSARRLADSAREDSEFLEQTARDLVCQSEGLCYADKLATLHPAIAKRMIRYLITNAQAQSGDGENVPAPESCHIEAVLSLCEKGNFLSSVSLPGRLRAYISDGPDSRGALIFERNDDAAKAVSEPNVLCAPIKLTIPKPSEELSFEFGRYEITVKRPDKCQNALQNGASLTQYNNMGSNIYNSSTYLLLKFDKIEGSVYIRCRQSGDVIKRGGINKKIKDIMSEAKTPSDFRSSLPIVCLERDGAEVILGIPGIAGAARTGFGADPNECHVLMIRCVPKKSNRQTK